MAELGELIRAARERQSAGAFPEAAELWRGILWRHPRHEDRAAWAYSYAEALRQNGEESRAAALFGRMQIVYPDRAEGFVGLALMHQSAGAYDLAQRLWSIALERWPSHADRRWWLSSAAFAPIELDKLEAAEQLCQVAISEFNDAPGGYAASSLAAERQFRWTDALSRIDRAITLSAEAEQLQLIASKARILRDMGATSSCRDLLVAETSSRKPSLDLAVACAQLAETTGPMAEAVKAWDRCMSDWPDEVSGIIGRAQLHRRMGEPDKGLNILMPACRRHPKSAALRQEMAEALSQARQADAAAASWQQVLQLAPSSLPLLLAYCRFLGSRGERDMLEKAITRRAPPHATALRCRYEFAKAARDLDSALAVLAELRRISPVSAWDGFAEAELRSWRQDPGDLEEAARILRGLAGDARAGASVTALLVRVLVLLGEADSAAEIVKAWPHGGAHAAWAEATIWSDIHKQDFDAAKSRWRDHASRFVIPALHLPAAELHRLRQSAVAEADAGLQLISIIRNELPRLARFLDHHRRLGVTHFVVVDNGSSDGSREYLEVQPDVTLYATGDSYAAAVFGVRWLNQLIDAHGSSGWIIHADADERLVYAGCEDRPLTDLVELMSRNGDEIVPAVMIDMFETPGGSVGMWFDPPRLRASARSPYFEAAGGARRRLFGTTVTLSKAPMIRAGSGIRYLSAHETTPGRVSATRMALLHDHLDYVLDSAGLDRVRDEVQRGQHSDFAVDRRRMLDQLHTIAKDLRGPESLLYTGSAQLLQLGLITEGPEPQRPSA